jgi:hypothetical protein
VSGPDAGDELWSDLLDGELPDDRAEELRTVLADGAMLQRAVDHYQLHRLLGLVHADDRAAFVTATMGRLPKDGRRFSDEVMAQLERAAPRRRDWRYLVGWSSAALLLVACGAGAWLLTRPPPAPVADLMMAQDARWGGAHRPHEGGRLAPGRYLLDSGRALIRCDGGARLAVVGPAVFDLDGADSARLLSGSLATRLAEGAGGFTLRTPAGLVRDLGTEFLVDAADGATELHVIAGSVALHPGAHADGGEGAATPVTAGTALRLRPDRPAEAIPLTARDFDQLVPARLAQEAGAGLTLYEGFAYHPQRDGALAGGDGWAGPWGRGSPGDTAGEFPLAGDSLPAAGTPRSGRALRLQGDHLRVFKRVLATPLAMGGEATRYLSFLYRCDRRGIDPAEDLVRVILSADPQQDQRWSAGIFQGRYALVNAGGLTTLGPEADPQAGVLRFVVKLVGSQAGEDRLFLLVQPASTPLPAQEPAAWTVTGHPFRQDAELSQMHVAWAAGSEGVVDEVRMGGSWPAIRGR